MRNLNTLDAGFQQNGVLITSIDMTVLQVPENENQRQMAKKQILDRLRTIPGVQEAAETVMVPISGNSWNEFVLIDQELKALSNFNAVSDNYFKTLEIPIIMGRDFDNHDNLSSPRVAIINESFKRKLLHDKNPIGKTFRLQVGHEDKDHIYEIVGLVKDTKYLELKEDFRPIVYLPQYQNDKSDMSPTFILRSN
ncbi:MAG: ABC efflux pump inner membrane subunit, partial [bacterium]